ncbi:transcriptional regulator [Entomohabitans teleogrylli]|uniref:transcriptional regulator n=1 Tax=Entomohabitans teleogrylli TaxID=1384589 RepID=UPI00073D5F86|nr:transcriptional regulator [Entomohabitans teleogrylli]
MQEDPINELFCSLEQIVLQQTPAATLAQDMNVFTEFEALSEASGLHGDELASAMGVTVATLEEWRCRRVKPSATEIRLMRLIHANTLLSKQLYG